MNSAQQCGDFSFWACIFHTYIDLECIKVMILLHSGNMIIGSNVNAHYSFPDIPASLGAVMP